MRALLSLMCVMIAACSGDSTSTTDMGANSDTGAMNQDASSSAVAEVTCPETPIAVYEASTEIGFGTVGNPTFSVGDVIRIDNLNGFPHTVTQRTAATGTPTTAPGGFDFDLPGNGSLCIQFNSSGEFPYYCRFHTSMLGNFVVAGAR